LHVRSEWHTFGDIATPPSSACDLDPEVAVIGAGPAGLATAACLVKRGMDVLVLERATRAGESWHRRYKGLRLNSVRWASSLPGYRMERQFGDWPSGQEWAAYLERYAQRHDFPIAFETEVERVEQASGSRWRLRTSRGELATRSVVIATGHDHTPRIPGWPGRERFEGKLIHSADFRTPDRFRGSSVVVVGAGNSGCEIAHLLATGRAGRVWIAVRTPPLILRREYLSLSISSLAAFATPLPDRAVDRLGWIAQTLTFGDLSRYGLLRSPRGLSKMRHSYWAPPLDSGFVEAVKQGRIEVVGPVERFAGNALVFADGHQLEPEAVIAATGFSTGLAPLVGHLGVLDSDEEPLLAGPRSPVPGLYFVGFRFGLCALLPYIERDAYRIAQQIALAKRRASRSQEARSRDARPAATGRRKRCVGRAH
jgi:putative flavoprotein involved in K+ transport